MAIDYIRVINKVTGAIDKRWEFNANGDTEGWFGEYEIYNFAVSGGLLTFQIRGYPVSSVMNDSLSIAASPNHVIKLRYRMSFPSGASSGLMRLYWRHDSTDVYLNGLERVPVTANNTWIVATAPVGEWGFDLDSSFLPKSLGGWRGAINRLRFDSYFIPGVDSTARYSGVDMYDQSGGTSMAAPAATGSVGLILQQMHEVWGINLTATPPYPSTLKAILVQTADDMVRTRPTRARGITPTPARRCSITPARTSPPATA